MKAIFAVAVIGALSAVLAHCGSDDCANANDHYTQCTGMGAMSSSSSSGGDIVDSACGPAAECKAMCINGASCTEIVGASPTLTSCLTTCDGK